MVRVSIGGHRAPRLAALAVLIVAGVVGGLLFRGRDSAGPCDPPLGPECPPGAEGEEAAPRRPTGDAPVMESADACRDAGYLCDGLREADRIVIRRWRDSTGTLVVSVPLPSLDDAAAARRLQRAAAAGIRLWNGRPFPIVIDERGTREPTIHVRWTRELGGARIGMARTQWSSGGGLSVRDIQLATHGPDPRRLLDPAQVRLVAAHEMGHALGLPHSDRRRDVMFPTNTATALSARDYRTVEALYALMDGTEIVP